LYIDGIVDNVSPVNVASFAVQTHCQCSAGVAVWCADIDELGNVQET